MFGNRNPRPPVGRQVPSQPPAPGGPYSRLPPDGQSGYGAPSSYGRSQPGAERQRPYGGPPSEKPEYSRGGAPRPTPDGQVWQLKPAKWSDTRLIFGNLCALYSPSLVAQLTSVQSCRISFRLPLFS